jgi:hypothetical protein
VVGGVLRPWYGGLVQVAGFNDTMYRCCFGRVDPLEILD